MSAAGASFPRTDLASAYSWRIWRKDGEEGNNVHEYHWFNLMCPSVFELAAIEMIDKQNKCALTSLRYARDVFKTGVSLPPSILPIQLCVDVKNQNMSSEIV